MKDAHLTFTKNSISKNTNLFSMFLVLIIFNLNLATAYAEDLPNASQTYLPISFKNLTETASITNPTQALNTVRPTYIVRIPAHIRTMFYQTPYADFSIFVENPEDADPAKRHQEQLQEQTQNNKTNYAAYVLGISAYLLIGSILIGFLKWLDKDNFDQQIGDFGGVMILISWPLGLLSSAIVLPIVGLLEASNLCHKLFVYLEKRGDKNNTDNSKY